MTARPVLSSPTANSFLDSELLTSFGVETLRDLIKFQRNVPEHRNLPQPRVFISHQRRDKNLAVTISKLAKKMGFDYWLDVHDPALRLATLNPNPDPVQQLLIVAILVEMALLNCSHVLAIVTRHTAGSLWVPCEYGRVKSISMFCPFASSLISRRVFNGGAFAAVFTQTMVPFLSPPFFPPDRLDEGVDVDELIDEIWGHVTADGDMGLTIVMEDGLIVKIESTRDGDDIEVHTVGFDGNRHPAGLVGQWVE